ncbi:hypothetical protein F7725_010136 [Dissostichus mawsoni]|uniref:Uncharacterized protein n=1 Tax=Dissostichus mawsoni TaxID=36200 RepID=A0A7J5XQP0_DISMA|nr:hypothetical protein F7725_010136 [Dissostichus mawsoni]
MDFDYMIGQPGVLSGEQVAEREGCPLSFTETTRFCFMLSDSEMSRCVLISPLWRPIAFCPESASTAITLDTREPPCAALGTSSVMKGVALRGGVLFHAVRLRNVPLCPDFSAVETNSEKSRISGFDYMIGQPGVLSGVRVHRDHFGHQRASVCSFGYQLGGRERWLSVIFHCNNKVLFHAVRLRNVPLCPDLSADSQAFCPESASTAITLDTREPPCAALGTSSVMKELPSGAGLRNVPLCPDLSAVETNSEKSRISGFDYMIGQPGVLSGVRVHRDHFGHQRASVCSFGTSSLSEISKYKEQVAEREAVRYLSLKQQGSVSCCQTQKCPAVS